MTNYQEAPTLVSYMLEASSLCSGLEQRKKLEALLHEKCLTPL